MFIPLFLLWAAARPLFSGAVSIEEFRPTEGVDSFAAARNNARALVDALRAANASTADRQVTIPLGKTYFMGQVVASGLQDITIQISGTVKFSSNFLVWGNDSKAMFWLTDSNGITISGGGTVDGQGLPWWRLSYTGHEIRPKMLRLETTKNILVHDITLLNSPTYHLYLSDCADVVIHDIKIFVDSYIQRGADGHDSVTYPLNTDGIDIMATNVTIFNCNITSYDDAIVAKPCKSTGKLCQCAGGILAYNNSIYYSTGLTIGSVPPSADVNCVRNVTFSDSYLYRPFKAIYIKSNPGDSGSGIIDQITYENIFIEQALWWTVWIGPQQQNQPGSGDGTGCSFLYPFVPQCPTQPLVTMSNIRLTNVTSIDTLPLFEGPGVILCDASNPCENVVFEGVVNTLFPGDADDIFAHLPVSVPQVVFPTKYRSDDWEFEYITSNVFGTATMCDPVPLIV